MNNSNHSEIIFALATANLKTALHLHRISGFGVFELLSPFIFSSQEKKLNAHLDLSSLASNNKGKPYTRYILIKDKYGNIIDDAIISLYPAPFSFTGEEIVELSLHGNPLLSLQLHTFLRSLNMREAKPGEFTQRAVLNGKLDLAQAEGINQLIHAESKGAINLARNNIEGILSKETLNIRDELLALLAYLEAHIDFAPDEVGEYDPSSFLPIIQNIKNKLTSLSLSYENGLKIKEGLKIVLNGKPNAGKSSLYNSLLNYEKAIVTHIPGTTRDILEEKLLIHNKDFILLDTAGIRPTTDIVEKMGIEKSLKSAKNADIICYLIDATTLDNKNYLTQISNEIFQFIDEAQITSEQKLIVILNKKDLIDTEFCFNLSQINVLKDKNCFFQLVLTSNSDLTALKTALTQYHEQSLSKINIKESPILISQRQKDKVEHALSRLEEAYKLILTKDYPEKIASLIMSVKFSLEEIIGEISIDNVFEKIFSHFCIGK